MVNHYTVSKKRRHTDAYTPGGEMGKRPDYATIVYCNLIRKKYKDAAIVAGGIEASLRRLAHYDYWSNKLKHSILVDAQADIVIYGMGEHAIVEIADALQSGIDIKDLSFIHGTVYKARNLEHLYEDYIELPSYDALQEDKLNYARSFKIQYDNTDHITAKILVEKYKDYQYVIQNPPAEPLMEQEYPHSRYPSGCTEKRNGSQRQSAHSVCQQICGKQQLLEEFHRYEQSYRRQ